MPISVKDGLGKVLQMVGKLEPDSNAEKVVICLGCEHQRNMAKRCWLMPGVGCLRLWIHAGGKCVAGKWG